MTISFARSHVDGPTAKRAGAHGGSWAGLFGYDIFISFALGPAPRGTRGYASDLARRLRERGFTVFFSEDEAPAGGGLDDTLRRALSRSRVLVVVVNHETLSDPRWVRTEVEEFRRRHPHRPVVPINIGGALQDEALGQMTEGWLGFRSRIWIDETREAGSTGATSDHVVARLVTAPRAVRSAVILRFAVVGLLGFFAALAAYAFYNAREAIGQRDRANESLLLSAAQQALVLTNTGRADEAWGVLLDTLAIARPGGDGDLPELFLRAALIALIEDRRGPELAFDAKLAAPPQQDDDEVPLIVAFNTDSSNVAAVERRTIAVWSTADGKRQMQIRVDFDPISIGFNSDSTALVIQGRKSSKVSESDHTEGKTESYAVAVEISSGRLHILPLGLCEQWIPCIATTPGKKRLVPLSQLPSFTSLERGVLPDATGFLASESGGLTFGAMSMDRFVLLRRENSADESESLLLDRKTGAVLPLKGSAGFDGWHEFVVAAEAPVLIASSRRTPTIAVYRIAGGSSPGKKPRLVKKQTFRDQGNLDTHVVQINSTGTLIAYRSLPVGTDAFVSIGRTVVLDLGTGQERWARPAGEVATGEDLIAVQENEGDTHVVSLSTGAEWFTTPGTPLGFDPAGRMLVMGARQSSDPNVSEWPRLWLVETLPVRHFSRDSGGGSLTQRHGCHKDRDLHLLTFSERFDRIWNRDDWHQSRASENREPRSVAAVKQSVGNPTTLDIRPEGNQWSIRDADEKPGLVETDEAVHRYPLLADVFAMDRPVTVMQSLSEDGQWIGLSVTPLSDTKSYAFCEGKGWWRVHRKDKAKPIWSGCADVSSDAHFGVQFLEGGMFAVASDRCHYVLHERESGRRVAEVVPALGEGAAFLGLAADVVGVGSFGKSTMAIQLQSLRPSLLGPVLVITTSEQTLRGYEVESPERPLFTLESDSSNTQGAEGPPPLSVDIAGDELIVSEGSRQVRLAIPPWGERLRERMRHDLRDRSSAPKRVAK